MYFLQRITDLICHSYQIYLSRKFDLPLLRMKNLANSNAHTVHVIGSGASALHTLSKGKVNDIYICANLAAALRKSWDVVFIEFDDSEKFFQAQLSCLANCRIKHLIFYGNDLCQCYPRKDNSSI